MLGLLKLGDTVLILINLSPSNVKTLSNRYIPLNSFRQADNTYRNYYLDFINTNIEFNKQLPSAYVLIWNSFLKSFEIRNLEIHRI